MYIEESFDTICNMDYGSGKSAMDERVKKLPYNWVSIRGLILYSKVLFSLFHRSSS